MADTAPDPLKDRGARRDHGPGGNGKDKPPMGLLDVTKDVAVSENNIPLSPQWLYAKTSEGKSGLPVTPGDTRPLSSSSQGALMDSTPRDGWRPEGSQDKKEWRRNGSDVESSRRWREEERETGSLGKREYRKGERENEYRKNDRRSDNSSMRESTDSRTALSSERRHEGASRTSGNEIRRDSKWSSRWGPEDKEKDPRMEKKIDADKEASHFEKQPIIGSTDKWRPLRHRQETHSGGSAVYRAAPGFGTERGRVEGANVGFGRGRGRSNSGPGLPISRTSSSAPIGAATLVMTDSLLEKSNLSGDAFRYPRGKLLDKYRMIKMQLDATPEGFVEAPQITLSSAMVPLAFQKPDSEEADALKDILKGKVTSSEACYDSGWESLEIATDSEIGTNIPSQISKNEVSALSNELDSGMTSAVSKDDQNGSKEVFYSEKVDQAKVKIDDEYAGLPESLIPDNHRRIYSTASLDSCTKVPDDASCDATFNHGTISSIETELTELGAPAVLSLFYMDPQGDIQGPFLPEDILTWHAQGFFGTDLPVRLSDAPENAHFRPLGDVLPELGWKPQLSPLIDPGLQSHQADTTRGNIEAVAPASEFSKFTNTRSEDPFPAPLSNSETFDGIPGIGNQNFNDFSGQDSEEVLYMGRSVSSHQKPFEKLANEIHGLSRTQSAHQFLASERGQAISVNQKVPIGNDVNPFGLSWSELKGTHQAPLSSNLAGAGDRSHIISHYAGDDASRLTGFLPETNRFNLDEHLLSQQLQNHELQHQLNPLMGGDASRNRHKDPFSGEINRFNLEEHLLSQQFQNEELQPQHLPSVHQNMHMGGAYLEQLQGPSHHHQSFNQAIDMERLLKLQLQQQRHLQQLEQEQQLHQQEQHIRYRMQLLQEQHQRQQHQLLLEQLLHQQQHDPKLGVPHAESVRGEAIDVYRQHLLHEMQQKSRHLPVDRDASLDRIQSKFGPSIHQQYNEVLGDLIHPRHRHMHSLEQQHLLGLQQEQLQSRQFPTAPSQQPGIGDERHADGVWSIDESGQFVRATAIPHQTRSGKLGQSDFVQALEQPSSYYDRMMRENYGLNSLHIDKSTSTPRPNVDVLENHGHLNSASQMGHFPFSNRPQQNMLPNQFTSAVERNWSGPIGQLSSNFAESQNTQFHLAAEQQKRDMQAQPLGLVGRASTPSSYMNREPSWPFPATNNSLNGAGQKMALGDSFSEGAFFANLGQTSQEHLTDLNFERQVDTLESSGRLPSRTSSGVSAEYKKFFLDTKGNGQLADYTGGEMGVLGASEGGGVKQAESSALDHGSLNVNGPVRHASFGGAGGGTNLFNYDRGVDNALDRMTTDRIPGVFVRGSESSLLMRANDQHTSSSKGALTEPVAVPLVKANSSVSFAYSEGTGWDPEGNLADAVSNTSSFSRKDARFQRASSYSDADASETSFIDMLKGTRRQMPETDSSAGASEPADAGQGRGSSKKKGKKGRQIDPALLGFKVHSNRILMGEIQRPDD